MDKLTLKDSVKNQPFRRFILKLTDGQEFEIGDPDRFAVSPDKNIAIVFIDQHYHVVDTDNVTSLEFFP